MADNQEKIDQLSRQLEHLLRRQEAFSGEIDELRKGLLRLKASEDGKPVQKEEIPAAPQRTDKTPEVDIPIVPQAHAAPSSKEDSVGRQPATVGTPSKRNARSNWEKFIGENLINKIGIIITIIGVAIGAKYSIEHNLISPLTRIVLGYASGLVLLGFGIRLKSNYENYSSVLVSGAMTILYFISYAAYDFYELIPQGITFALMVVFTAFTITAALNYNKQIIAVLGLVGAYAVPFLLSDGSGKVAVLYSYMVILNCGVLIIAFKKYWKPLFFSAFVLTWLIYVPWVVISYEAERHFALALLFLLLFFLIFYITFIAYKMIGKEKFSAFDVLLVMSNSFIFYGIGYGLVSGQEQGNAYLGLFTLGNALIHFVVSVLFFRQKHPEKNIFYMIAGLVLVFITIAVPVQLDGNWVSLLWAFEAALLFWIGRTKGVAMYERLAYPLIVLSFFSLVHDWILVPSVSFENPDELRVTPLLNINFFTSMAVAAALGLVTYLDRSSKYQTTEIPSNVLASMFSVVTPVLLGIVLYFAFVIEIDTYWEQLYADSRLILQDDQTYNNRIYNWDLRRYNTIWLLNYSLIFLGAMSLFNITKIGNRLMGIVNLVLSMLALLLFLTLGLYALSELRESYLDQTLGEFYTVGPMNIGIRYVSFVCAAMLLWSCYHYGKQAFMKINFRVPFEFMLHICIIWVASSELLHWMDLAGANQSHKLSLSIFWGTYSLLLIVLGIWKRKQYLRIGAIVLFGITLIKLFLYDISHLNTISKTIVFVALGVLLLIISFLYNRFKNSIANESES
ncbi:DUF2339 domain-containing protein [Flavobacteriaceae bacterium 3-367]|uniref:DUF2339 domain-containing protein n=1 Tax=Eudoraea algarum TaxID=3417568 RepID=UPI00327E4205